MQDQIRKQLFEVLKQRKEHNPSYSLRALARDIGLSASLISDFLKNKRNLNERSYQKIEVFLKSLTQKQKNTSFF